MGETQPRPPVTWRDRALWLAWAIGFTYTPVSYLGAMWPGGPGAAIAILIGAAATLFAVKYVRWVDPGAREPQRPKPPERPVDPPDAGED